MRREIERDDWQTYLEEFSERNQWRIVQLRVAGQVGAPRVEYDVPLVGVRLEMDGEGAPLAEVSLSDDSSGTCPSAGHGPTFPGARARQAAEAQSRRVRRLQRLRRSVKLRGLTAKQLMEKRMRERQAASS